MSKSRNIRPKQHRYIPGSGVRYCWKCKQDKPIDTFLKQGTNMYQPCRKDYGRKGYLRRKSEGKTLAYAREYRKANSEAIRKRFYRRQYGLTVERYAEMFAAQKGVCAICGGVTRNGKALSVDHCHASNRVRGLLCDICNVGLGAFKEDPTRLRKAVEYLATYAPVKLSA